MTILYSALFIDYDNVRASLDEDDPQIGARFSNRPLNWLTALESGLALPPDNNGRRIVSRRCYASPHQINSYRRNFTQTGFEVVDCPPLTTHMKNSADIYIVMDVVDYLSRYPHIDEYIILSADADFVPVLNRLRKELKHTAIFTATNTSSAYKNCSDETIQTDFFATHLADASAPRGVTGTVAATPDAAIADSEDLADDIRSALRQATVRRAGTLPFATAAQAVSDSLGARLGGNWAGKRTFGALLESLDLSEFEVDWDKQELRGQFDLVLTGWDGRDEEALVEFVTDVLVAANRTLPLLPPPAYALIFDALAAYYNDDPRSFSEAVSSVAATCAAHGVAVSANEVRFIANGISMQGYRFGPEADAANLAGLWRMQLFDLCGEPGWLREPEDAELLATWCRASTESIEAARDDFLARVGESLIDPGDASGPE